MTRQFHISKGILLALFAMFLFCVNDGLYKYILQFTKPEIAISLGFGFSFLVLLGYAIFKRISLKPQNIRNIIVFSLFFLTEQALFLYALRHLPIAELFVVLLAAPVFVLALSGLILKEHLTRMQVFAILSGLAGALIVVATPLVSIHESGNTPDATWAWICAILNFMCNGSKIIYMRKYCQTENNFSMSMSASLSLAVAYGLMVPWQNTSLSSSLLIITATIGTCSAVGFIAYVRAFQLEKAALVSATQYSQILWAILMGVFIFHEELTLAAVTGSLMILASGYFLYLRKVS